MQTLLDRTIWQLPKCSIDVPTYLYLHSSVTVSSYCTEVVVVPRDKPLDAHTIVHTGQTPNMKGMVRQNTALEHGLCHLDNYDKFELKENTTFHPVRPK